MLINKIAKVVNKILTNVYALSVSRFQIIR
jgi:hypothetical protein